MLCEQVLGKLHDFDITGKTIEYVDIEWHEAFKKIHKKITDKGTNVISATSFVINIDEIKHKAIKIKLMLLILSVAFNFIFLITHFIYFVHKKFEGTP